MTVFTLPLPLPQGGESYVNDIELSFINRQSPARNTVALRKTGVPNVQIGTPVFMNNFKM
jgi:hypothetical protein